MRFAFEIFPNEGETSLGSKINTFFNLIFYSYGSN